MEQDIDLVDEGKIGGFNDNTSTLKEMLDSLSAERTLPLYQRDLTLPH